jgi:hypothetical protein
MYYDEALLKRFEELIIFRNCTYDLTIEHRDLLSIQINAIADVLGDQPIRVDIPFYD